MSDTPIEIAARDGEILLLKQEVERLSRNAESFLDQMWFWRGKYLSEHPEKNNWDYAVNAYSDETGKPSSGDAPPSEMHEGSAEV